MSAERVEGEVGWAEDFDGVWHRMSSGAWSTGVGPADPVACCGRQVDSVHYSTFDPRELDDRTEVLCDPPITPPSTGE